MERFIHRQNLELYRRLLAESNVAEVKDEGRHSVLLTLLVDEEAKDQPDAMLATSTERWSSVRG